MWDFSWLERRWPGAGYEDWAQALEELRERGYDAVRIDAYPHLLAEHAAWAALRLGLGHLLAAPAIADRPVVAVELACWEDDRP